MGSPHILVYHGLDVLLFLPMKMRTKQILMFIPLENIRLMDFVSLASPLHKVDMRDLLAVEG